MFRLFLIAVICVYTVVFVFRLYRRFARIAKVFWFVSEYYYAKKSVDMRKFYSQNLHPYLLIPQPHIIKFFDVKQHQKKVVTLNKIDSFNGGNLGSFITHNSSFGSKSRFSEEFSFPINNSKPTASKYAELDKKCPKSSNVSVLLLKWLFFTTGKWILLFVFSLGLGFLNNLMISAYAKKLSLQTQLLEIKTNTGRLKALSDLWNYANQRDSTILESYVSSRKTTLSNLYNILAQVESNGSTQSSEYIFTTMFRNLTRNSTSASSDSINGEQISHPESPINHNLQANNSSTFTKESPDGFMYQSDGSLIYNYTDINLVIEKGFKHTLLSLLNTLDYNLLLPNTVSRGVKSEMWVNTFEEKLIEILIQELETAESVNNEAISSFRLTFLLTNVGSIFVMLVIYGLAAKEWLRFHRHWKETNFIYVINSLNLISDKEIEQNRALVRACLDVFQECGI